MSIKSTAKKMACLTIASMVLTVGAVQTGLVNSDDVFDVVSITAEAATKSTAKTIKTKTPAKTTTKASTKTQTPAKTTAKTSTKTQTQTATTKKPSLPKTTQTNSNSALADLHVFEVPTPASTKTQTQTSTNVQADLPSSFTKEAQKSAFIDLHVFEIKTNLIENKYYDVVGCSEANPITPHYECRVGMRSPYNYNTVIDQFMVESNYRYKKKNGNTYCNIFAWDVMSAMGVELPHNITKEGVPCLYEGGGASIELKANGVYHWMAGKGKGNYTFDGGYGVNQYGWWSVDAQTAQFRANQGYPTIGIYQNPCFDKSGHVVVVRPETAEFKIEFSEDGIDAYPVVAQAGGDNSNYGYYKNPSTVYFTHD